MSHKDLKLPSNQKFGLFFAFIFIILSSFFFFGNKGITSFFFLILSVSFLIVSLIKPELLFPLNKLWMRFGFLLGMVINPIVLGILFFVLFTPISIIMKIFGRDELQLGLKKKSYWKRINKKSLSIESFKNQF